MTATSLVLLCLPGILVAFDPDAASASSDMYDIDPPHVTARRVTAAQPVRFTPGEDTPAELWRQVLPYDVNLRETASYVDSKGTRHAFAMQMLGDTPIWNAVGNLNVQSDGKVIGSYQRFLQSPSQPPNDAWTHTTVADALEAVQETVSNPNLTADKGQLVYVRDNSGHIKKAWHLYAMEGGPVDAPTLTPDAGTVEGELMQGVNVNTEVPLYENYWDALVDADSLELIALSDLIHRVAPYHYNVFSMPTVDPTDGHQSMQTEQFDESYSPIGWHNLGAVYGNYVAPYTIGNNIFAMTSDYKDFGFSSSGEFNFPFDQSQAPEDQLPLCLTQLFYTNNRLHDIFYAHGFDEASGNFQLNNFGLGGLELDPIYALCHANGKNNAMMLTLPDGTPGVMSMFIWDLLTPKKDSALDSGVVTHEYTHGMSNRLTGGPSSMCLTTKQSQGLGEGWGDFMALAFHFSATDNRNEQFGLGGYLNGQVRGVRRYAYTSDMAVNPTDWSYYMFYKTSVHKMGEIWCIVLYEAYWNLVEEFGFSDDLINGDGGNNLMISLVIDGMKYQPCEPTFLQARDAIMAALYDRTNDPRVDKAAGALWAAFAKRGLGENAGDGGIADHDVPSDPAALVSGSPSSDSTSRLSSKAPPRVIDAILIALAATVAILLVCGMSLACRNWRLRRALRDKHSRLNDRTPLRAAVDSPYQV